jgi:hypothetical protein
MVCRRRRSSSRSNRKYTHGNQINHIVRGVPVLLWVVLLSEIVRSSVCTRINSTTAAATAATTSPASELCGPQLPHAVFSRTPRRCI